MDLSVNYLGIKLKSPVVVGSSGLTFSIDRLKQIEQAGAGAVVLKSIFEEEIQHEFNHILEQESRMDEANLEYLDYYDFKIKEDNINRYIDFIKEAKKTISIPVIASINCRTSHEWAFFAKKLQDAGADALEINLFTLPSDFSLTAEDVEKSYIEIITRVKEQVTIPVAAKISYHFANLAAFAKRLSQTGIDGIVMFNRFFQPDFDIEQFKVVPTNVLSNPSDAAITLRWMSIFYGRIDCNLIASTGIHDGSTVIKEILAGADAVQVVSTLYKNGVGYIATMLEELQEWMEKHNFNTLDDFRGKMSQKNSPNPAEYERVQFMKYFQDKKYDLD
ncbi:MAG: dihydroorotate dehydrogenase-like protein [Chlorobi bacterium]|nr:dihydroorotate dehydrogenase-like protein [Chlorobiota bacterium]